MISNYKILGIIPARGGSKRVPGKNKKLLAGKPLINYAIESALTSKYIDTLVISTDDSDIIAIAEKFDSVIPIRRPDQIAGDDAPAITYVRHALEFLDDTFEIIVIIQPSSPFTTSMDIDCTIEMLNKNQHADSSVSVMKLDHAIHPAKLKILDHQILLPYLEEENGRMSAQELPNIYVRNCSVYASRISTIEKGSIIGDISAAYIMPRERSIDINDPIDFEFAEFLMHKNGQ